MKRLETEWHSYSKSVIPKNASSTQRIEMRRAFFAGAWAFHMLTMNRLDSGEEVTEGDVNFMKNLHDEMVGFNERVLRGEA